VGAFAVICYSSLLVMVWNAADRVKHPAYYYPVVIGLAALGLFLTLRLVLGYKTVTANNSVITVKQKFLFRHLRYDLKTLLDWEEIVIQTFNGEYRQLKLNFSAGRLQVSKQEYTDYEKLKAYLRQKSPPQKH
jgi:hypothetical protein